MPSPKARRPRSPKSSTGSILINFVLDKSGSMNSVVNDAIGGFNTYLRELKRDKGANYRFSLTLFDTEVENRYTNAILNVIPELYEQNVLAQRVHCFAGCHRFHRSSSRPESQWYGEGSHRHSD